MAKVKKKSGGGEKKSGSSALAKAREKMEALKKHKSRGGGVRWGTFPEGKMILRVFPYNPEEGDIGLESDVHPNVGPKNQKVKCLKPFGKECPIDEACDAAYKAARAAKSEGKPEKVVDKLYEKAKNLKVRKRFYIMGVRLTENGPVGTGKENNGEPIKDNQPEVFEVGTQIMEQMLGHVLDEDADTHGPFWEEGNEYDFLVIREGKDKQTEYTVKTSSKYAKGDNAIDTSEFMENLPDLAAKFGDEPSLKEVKAALMGVEASSLEEAEDEDVEVDEEDEDEKPSKKKGKKKDDDEEDEEVSEDEDADEDESDEDEESDDEDSDEEESDDEDEDESDDEDEKPKKGKKKSKADDEDEEESEDEDSDEESDEDEEGEEDEESDDDEEESDDEDEKPAKKKGKGKADDEDESEDEEDEEESDDEDSDDESDDDEGEEESPKAKGKGKKADADEDEDSDGDEDEAEESDDSDEDEGKDKRGKRPICFGDADDHNPKDKTCLSCKWHNDCAATKAVSEKVYGVKGGGAKFGQPKKKGGAPDAKGGKVLGKKLKAKAKK